MKKKQINVVITIRERFQGYIFVSQSFKSFDFIN